MTILANGLFITVLTHWLSSFVLCCSDTVLAMQQTAAAQQSSYCYMCCPRTARAIHLASPVINKKSGRKLYSFHAWSYERRELIMSKFSLWLIYSTCRNVKRKPQQKINVFQLHNTRKVMLYVCTLQLVEAGSRSHRERSITFYRCASRDHATSKIWKSKLSTPPPPPKL